MLDAIRKIDAFPKAYDDFRVKTTSGAIISILAVVFMSVLFLSELHRFITPLKVDHLYVNTTRASQLTIDFDISFTSISCSMLAVDAFDDRGMSQIDAVHEIYKHRLSPEGEKLGTAEQADLGHTLLNEAQLENIAKETQEMTAKAKEAIGVCGKCYGAGRPGQCCNTCQDVRDAYERLGWHFKAQGIVQCSTEAYISTLREQYADDGGCQ
eukprot:gene44191-54032_t